MSQAKRASSDLRNKVNIHPVNNRRNEATAEDFEELGEIIQDHAERIDLFQNTSFRSEFYGYFLSIEILEATHPEAVTDAFAIIVDADGRPKQIAKWNDTTAEWELSEMGEVIHRANKSADFPNVGDENVFYYAKDSNRLYIWLDLDYRDLTPPSADDIILGTYINETQFNDEWGNPVDLIQAKLYVDRSDWYFFDGTELRNLMIDYLHELTDQEVVDEASEVFGLVSGKLLNLIAGGKNIELRVHNEEMQWRLEGDTVWNVLFELAEITPEFRVSEGVFEYKRTPTSPWQELFSIDEFVVFPTIGENGNWWVNGQDTGVSAQAMPTTVYDDDIAGIRDGQNTEFFAPDAYISGTLAIYLDGQRLSRGNNKDYIEIIEGAKINRVITPKNLLIFEYIKAQ